MFIPRTYEKYTNYNGYICDRRMGAKEVDQIRLLKVIDKLSSDYKKPYIRFMWVPMKDVTEAVCFVYSDKDKMTKLTKLVPFSEAERVVMGKE